MFITKKGYLIKINVNYLIKLQGFEELQKYPNIFFYKFNF